MEERIISSEEITNERSEIQVEQTLRPQLLEEYIGQESVREKISLFINT